ncbi:hypothetical protein PHYSODRAFT_305867 [Phytophthora sojae]|uniref:RxLR effector protein n=1 Tax=Phytophthora sojae (strain P6497) TaxID=1094619 RepID=G5A6Y6_PHYSP|nr:hypothetical protein PHYSODRAFT_305867 [Phytophthora sojae]EGZ09091.1 hypothetical protein PHYSODRAFT_305867 [Phytophthora sojae]|eukprot:XP_009535724.1 hypothetical protein PHYSODRAFT_305867 [Phytophthora sojae]
MRFSLALILTLLALIATTLAHAEVVQNEEVQDTSRNLRVGIIKLQGGSRSAEVIVMLDDSNSGSTDVLEIAKPQVEDSEERFVAVASWVQALKNFVKNPVQFTLMFVLVRRFFAY